MRQFSIIPIDKSVPSIETKALDASCVIHDKLRLGALGADVHEGGTYLFSIQSDDWGVLKVFHRATTVLAREDAKNIRDVDRSESA